MDVIPNRPDKDTEKMLVQHCLNNKLGFIPDAEETFFSLDAIASFSGHFKKTLQNRATKERQRLSAIAHPFGAYYRLSDYFGVLHGKEEGA